MVPGKKGPGKGVQKATTGEIVVSELLLKSQTLASSLPISPHMTIHEPSPGERQWNK